MKKILGLGAAALAIPAAIASAALLSPAVAGSDPGTEVNSLNVVGEPYGRAVSILKSQGVKATFGGAFGSDVGQAQCIVDKQTVNSVGKTLLMLDCTEEAAAAALDRMPAGAGVTGEGGVRLGTNGQPLPGRVGIPMPVGGGPAPMAP